jgi:uncharacterized protein
MHKLLSSISLCLLLCSAAAVCSAQSSAEIAGAWVGEYRFAGERIYVSVGFKVENGSVSGTMLRPLEENAERQLLSMIMVRGENVRFQLQRHNTAPVFMGLIKDGRISGEVSYAGTRGTFELIHVARLDPKTIDDYVDDYRTDQGRLVIIGRTLGSLYYFDPESGRTGPLLPTSDTDFFSGPSNAVAFPIDAKVNFQKKSDGSIAALSFSLGTRTTVNATKVKLYTVEDVSFQNGEVRLSGSLKLPLTAGPHPAVVMLHGSNAQSRNGQDSIIGFNADHLARMGFAVLTYDKRGVGKSTGKREDIGLDGDALAGIALLRARKDIDPKQIGLWGLSQGGMIAPQIAAQTDIAFIVSVGGAVVHGHQQETERVELQMRADGFPESEIREAVAFQTLKFNYARTGQGWDEYAAAYQQNKNKKWFPDPYIGPPESKDDPGFAVWRAGAGGFSPGDHWEKYKGPVLYVLGEFETYSKPSTNTDRFKQAMAKAGNRNYTISIIPQAEHAMREAKNGGPKELPYLNRFAPVYFKTLSDWLKRRVLSQP